MQLHLKLKPSSEKQSNEVFHRSQPDGNQIVLNKYGTVFDFKSVSAPSLDSQDSQDLFSESCKNMIDTKLLKGEDCLLFTLGPSNSGKSHTVFGPLESGLTFLSLKYIFDQLQQKQLSSDFSTLSTLLTNLKKTDNLNVSSNSVGVGSSHVDYAVTLSMFEIYNDSTKDLLDLSTNTSKSLRSDIITDPIDHKLRPFNCSQYLVTDYESATELIQAGLKSRTTASTFVNNESSRSHCFVFINLLKVFKGLVTTSRFTIADLAGLERSKLSQTTGVNLREGSFTNGSLTQLGRCLELAVTKQFNVSLLRTNKLTRLIFNDFARKKSPISIIVTLDPFGDEGLTIQTLRYVNPVQYQKFIKASANSNINNKSIFSSSSSSSSQRSSSSNIPNEIIEEIEHMRAHQSKLQKKVIQLEDEIIVSENKIRNQFYKDHEKQLGSLKDKYSIEKLKLQEKSKQITDVKLEELSHNYRDKILELNNLLNEKVNQLNTIENDSMKVKEEISVVHQKCETLETELANKKNSYDLELQKLNSLLENSKAENSSLVEQIVSLKKTSDELNEKVKDLRSTLISKEKELSKQISSNGKLNIKLEDLSKEKSKISEESTGIINKLNEKIENLKDQLTESTNLYKIETKSLQTIKFNLEKKEKELTEQNNLNSKLNNKLEKLSEEKSKISVDSTHSIEELNKKIENLKNHLAESALSFDNKKKSLESIKSELVLKEEELSRQKTFNNELNLKLEQSNQEKSKILKDSADSIGELNKKIENLENQFSETTTLFNNKKKSLKKVISELKEKLSKQSTVSNDTESEEFLNLKKENELLRLQSETSEKESNQLTEKYEKNLRDLRSQLENAKTKLNLLDEPSMRNLSSRSVSPIKSPNKSFGLEINQLLDDNFEIYDDKASQEILVPELSSDNTKTSLSSPFKKKDKSVSPSKSRSRSSSPSKKSSSKSPSKKKVSKVNDTPEIPTLKASIKKATSVKKSSPSTKSKVGSKTNSKFIKEVDFLINNPFKEKDEDKENTFVVLNSLSKKASPPPLLEVSDEAILSNSNLNSKRKSKNEKDSSSKKRHLSPKKQEKHSKKKLRATVLEDLDMSD